MKTFYLDTCVWGVLAESEAAQAELISYFQSSDRILALSYFDLFELSRAPKAFPGSDALLLKLRHRVYIPSLNDQVIESEMASFPNVWRMRWLPLEQITGGEDLEILQTFADNPQFAASRDDHYQFGLDNFMGLERLKENFPPLHGDEWMVEDADAFAWGTAMDYLGRHFPRFLRSHWDYIRDGEFDSLDSLLSLRARSLFVFFKYYLHRQAPGKSDFFDFLHVSYAPYCDVFVTERNVCNVLRRIKNEDLMLAQTEILHISDLISEVRRASDAL